MDVTTFSASGEVEPHGFPGTPTFTAWLIEWNLILLYQTLNTVGTPMRPDVHSSQLTQYPLYTMLSQVSPPLSHVLRVVVADRTLQLTPGA